MIFLGLFLTSFLAGSFVPLGSEAHLIYLANEGYSFYPLLLIATIGNTLGGLTCYLIALYGGRPLIKKYFNYMRNGHVRAALPYALGNYLFFIRE